MPQDDQDREEGNLHEDRWRPRPKSAVVRRLMQGVLAAVLILVGVAGTLAWSKWRTSSQAIASKGIAREARSSGGDPGTSPAGTSMPPMPGMPGMNKDATAQPESKKTDEALEVSLTPEAVERAGIKTARARIEPLVSTVTVPGTVTSNAYRDTKVNALVGGITRQVSVELGSPVRRGQALAVIFSAEFAEAQMKYLSMQAMLEADHQKLERTQKLVAIGAASRQELEEVTAIHTAHETEVAAARQRLVLLGGLSSDQVARLTDASHVVAEISVPAPADGVVIMRSVNPGQVVGAAQELFTVTDLSTVWVIGDLYEKDFGSVRVGSEASITIPSAPKSVLRGRVTYIDPRVDPAARTAKVRVEVPNRGGELKLGMYVPVSFESGSAARVTVVPRDAVQSVGDRTVVYVPTADGEGRFTERPVKVGPPIGDAVSVLEGLKPGEQVVTQGSFFLRSEATRMRSGG
ncbi:MAG TPA: efflux RND transporter periplasmic adaptor subunit [Gemmatimonadales bacterium]|nr:efflux RND transporter periplasmic adaptor subunit [Gemmatimonadales bacterium]